jgi:hypothetical protein
MGDLNTEFTTAGEGCGFGRSCALVGQHRQDKVTRLAARSPKRAKFLDFVLVFLVMIHLL